MRVRKILYVEGKGDIVFFQELIRRIFEPKALEIEVKEMGGKANLKRVLETGIKSLSLPCFGVALDLNTNTPSEFFGKVKSDLGSICGRPPEEIEEGIFKAGESFVHIIPIGLPEDERLKTLEIKRHSREDYLLKILLEDVKLTRNIPDFPMLLKKSIKFFAEEGIRAESSKDLLQLAKFILHEDFEPGDKAFTTQVLSRADLEVIKRATEDILIRLQKLSRS